MLVLLSTCNYVQLVLTVDSLQVMGPERPLLNVTGAVFSSDLYLAVD